MVQETLIQWILRKECSRDTHMYDSDRAQGNLCAAVLLIMCLIFCMWDTPETARQVLFHCRYEDACLCGVEYPDIPYQTADKFVLVSVV